MYIHPPDFYNNLEEEGSGSGSGSDSNSGDKGQEEAESKYPITNFKAFTRRRPIVDFTAYRDMLNSI